MCYIWDLPDIFPKIRSAPNLLAFRKATKNLIRKAVNISNRMGSSPQEVTVAMKNDFPWCDGEWEDFVIVLGYLACVMLFVLLGKLGWWFWYYISLLGDSGLCTFSKKMYNKISGCRDLFKSPTEHAKLNHLTHHFYLGILVNTSVNPCHLAKTTIIYYS